MKQPLILEVAKLAGDTVSMLIHEIKVVGRGTYGVTVTSPFSLTTALHDGTLTKASGEILRSVLSTSCTHWFWLPKAL